MRGAAEALYQATQLAGLDAAVQKARLWGDVGYLPTPARLHKAEERVVLAALEVFSFEEKTELGEGWGGQVVAWVEEDTEPNGNATTEFAHWVRDRLGHYQAAQTLLKVLLEVTRRIFGEEDVVTFEITQSVAMTLLSLGDLQQARALQETVF